MERANIPEWYAMKRRRPSAHALLEHYGLLRPPVDVFGLAKAMDVNLVAIPDYHWAGSVVSTSRPLGATIAYRAEDPHVRQRFTVAHEIGHLMLHPIGEEFRDDSSFGGDIREAQANGYAANLLMPENAIYRHARFSAETVDELARMFEVSRAAMKIRLAKLGLL
jgi:Zn-dependent peptidase ImmA (M78 family)